MWLRRLWQRDPLRVIRMFLRVPGEKKREKRHRSHREEPRSRNGRDGRSQRKESVIPREYAEDVEFVEIKEFSKEENLRSDDYTSVTEEQVSDVEYEEIREKK